jgi:sugar phosphate isomerase/epimerase
MNIALQMYSVRDEVAKNFKGAFEAVAKMGYKAVEFAGYGNMSAKDLKAFMDSLGLTAASTHIMLDRLESNLDKELDYALELDCTHVVCPWFQASAGYSWLKLAETLESLAQRAKAKGVTLAYHNHAHELTEKIDGKHVMDVLLEKAPSLSAELDVAWLHAGGVDPVTYLPKYTNRTPLVHIKDVRRAAEVWDTVELGKGEVNLSGVLGVARHAQWLIIEQDHSETPMQSAQRNLEWLQTHLT